MSSLSTNNQTKNGKIRYLDSPSYEIVGEVKPFPHNMTAFSRIQWDPTCIGHGERRQKSTAEIIAEGKPGYSQVDFSLQAAAWPVHGEKCLYYWRVNGTNCSNCISSCPLSQ